MEEPTIVRASLRDFLSVIFKRKAQILLFFFATVCTVTIGTFMAKPTYEAKAQILVKAGRESMYVPPTGSGNAVVSNDREEQINSEIEILKSRSLLEKVIAKLGPTAIYPDLAETKKGWLATLIPSRQRENFTLGEKALPTLQKKIEIQGIKKSNVIEIGFKHSDPRTAAAVVNTLAAVYLDRHVDVHKAPHSYEFFQEQSNFLKEKLGRNEARLKELKKKYNVTELDAQQTMLLQRIQDQRMALNQTESQIVEVENRISLLNRQFAETPKTIDQGEETDHNSLLINTLEARLVELQLKEKELLTKYTDNSRLVQSVKDEIGIVENKLAQYENKRFGKKSSGVNPTHRRLHEDLLHNKVEFKALQAKREAQTGQLAKYEQELEALNKIEVEHDQLEQEVAVDRQNYRLYLTKFEESRITDAMDSEKMVSVSLIESAEKPLKPISPKKLLNLVLGLFLGAFGGLGLAFFLHYLDDTLETVEDVETGLQLPVLASSWR